MRGHIVRVSAFTSVLLAAAGAARADVCVAIDSARDTFSPQDQTAAVLLVSRQFELAGERIAPPGCPASYSLSHIRLGNTIVVHLSGPNGQREATALGMDDLPALYNQMVRSMVTGRPLTGLSVVDRTNVTASQATAKRVYSDSLWYARLGYGSIFGDDTYGAPSLGFGYRAELDSLGIDISFLNYLFQTHYDDFDSGNAFAMSLLKLSGLYFVSPQANRTAYLGGGLSYGSRKFGEGSTLLPNGIYRYNPGWHGNGLQGELTIGYELARATSVRMFVQADAILPFYQVTSERYTPFGVPATTDRRYAPSFVVSVGVGR